MALRKQPDRGVKKKRKIEMPENLKMAKRKRELEEPRNFDIIGTLLCNYGMTGDNLVRDIFSYMDVSSLQGGHLVCKTWNVFLINDRKLWMDILRQTRPYFELLKKQLVTEFTDEDSISHSAIFNEERIFSESYFDFVGKNEDFCSQNIIKIFKRIQMIHIVLQDVVHECPDYEVFQNQFIGQKLAGEIQLQMDQAKKEKQQLAELRTDRFDFRKSFAWMFNEVTRVMECRDEIEFEKELKTFYDNNIYEELLEKYKVKLDAHEMILLIGIRQTVRDSCVDV